jgi:hypothetical protein
VPAFHRTPTVSRLPLTAVALSLLAASASGCVSRIALDRAVLGYDRTTAESVSKQLLLNIARARQNQPMHFTAISNIAATQKLTMLLRQGYDVDALLRLMGSEIRLEENGQVTVRHNRPSDREGAPIYRRVMAQLSTIQDRHALHVEPLHYQYNWTVPAAAVTPEAFQSTYKEFTLTYDPEKEVYRVAKRVNGRVVVTNYDPAVLSNEERFVLHEQADDAPFNDILVDIRPGYTGGEVPIHGRLRLRSFHEVLTFLGRGMEEEPEFDVPPDPRTPSISENPPHTLEIVEGQQPPKGASLSVELNGNYYAVKPQTGYQWNRKVFSLLYQLFQMSVSTVAETGPAITIAK